MILIRVGDPIPPDHYVDGTITLPPIDPESVTSASAVLEDITSYSSDSQWREFDCVGVNVNLKSGACLYMGREVFGARIQGGGEFYRCLPNADHVCPLTEEQVERAKDEIGRWDDDEDDYYNEGDEEEE